MADNRKRFKANLTIVGDIQDIDATCEEIIALLNDNVTGDAQFRISCRGCIVSTPDFDK